MDLHFFNLNPYSFEIYNNLKEKIFEFRYFPYKKYYSLRWLGFLNDGEIKSILAYSLDFLSKHNYSHTQAISNHREMEGGLTDELIDWGINHFLRQAVYLGLKNLAIVKSPDFYTQLAFEGLAEKLSDISNLNKAFFDDYKQAEDWLLQQQTSYFLP